LNETFKEYVTGTHFSLSLSKGQIFALACLVNEDQQSLLSDGRFMVYLSGLHRRGLVSHNPKVNPMLDTSKSSWTVTKAGKYTFNLLQEAGLLRADKTCEGDV